LFGNGKWMDALGAGESNAYTGLPPPQSHFYAVSVSQRSDEHEKCGRMKKKQRTKWAA
jgi:hypothetical protein